MNILGLNLGHDGSAAVVIDHKLSSFISTERITRNKKQRGVTDAVISYVLQAAGICVSDLDAIVICNLYSDRFQGKPLFDFSGLFDVDVDPDSFSKNIGNVLYMTGSITYKKMKKPLFLVNHHTAHCAYSYYSSPFTEALSISFDVSDEVGCNNSIHLFSQTGARVDILKRDSSFNVGHIYSSLCDYAGFYPSLVGAGKLMALAAYGKPYENISRYGWPPPSNGLGIDNLKTFYLQLGFIPPDYYNLYPQLKGEGGVVDPVWLNKEDWSSFSSIGLAATAQHILQTSIHNYLKEVSEYGLSDNLCLSGGLALNCVNNGLIHNSGMFKNVFVAPASADDGLAIGGAYLIANHFSKKGAELSYALSEKDHFPSVSENIGGGVQYSEQEIQEVVANSSLKVVTCDKIPFLALQLSLNQTVGWFQGRSEIGPRALGRRSILANPAVAENKEKLNKLKGREDFRPFSPAVLLGECDEWFALGTPSPYMLKSVRCRSPEKIPAAVHLDWSARVQTVAEDCGDYYELIKKFYDITGVPCLLNTSFNTGDEPIVETPYDAVRSFLALGLDYLVLENVVLSR